MPPTETPRHSIEELANTITHGIGLVFSIIGFVVLLILALMHGGPGKPPAAPFMAPRWSRFTPLPLSTTASFRLASNVLC